jgi:glutathione synthase/RimK-type ligase-like ATP-grasp enzyme
MRSALSETASADAWMVAARIAKELLPPDDVFAIDICEAAGELRLLELNPFSGADLYSSSATSVVAAVSEVARDIWEIRHATE